MSSDKSRTVSEQQQSIVDGLREYSRASEHSRKAGETAARLAEGRRLVEDMKRWMDAGGATLEDMMAQGSDEANRSAREEIARRISGQTGTISPHALTGFAGGRVSGTGCLTERLFTRAEVLAVIRAERARHDDPTQPEKRPETSYVLAVLGMLLMTFERME
jgi:hypothetical protein